MRLFVLALVALSLHAQTQLRLRTGGPATSYRITAATPAGGNGRTTITVVNHATGAAGHAWANGDYIFIHDVVGCPSINGDARVQNVNAVAGTAELTTTADAPLACNGTFDVRFQSGWAGKTELLTVNSTFPRLIVPPSGAIRTRIMDPDGAPGSGVTCTGPPSSSVNPGGQVGCGVAPVVVENGPAWQGMLSAYSPLTTVGCDPYVTTVGAPGFCTNAHTQLGAQQANEGWGMFVGAYVCNADRGKTDYCNMAKFFAFNLHRMLVQDTSNRWWPGFPCDTTAQHCGIGSGSEWISEGFNTVGNAYDLMRNILTVDERTTFIKKMLHDAPDGCDPSLTLQPTTVSVPAGSIPSGGDSNYQTITANTPGGFAGRAVGEVIYVKNNTYKSTGYWAFITAIVDDSNITVRFRVNSLAWPTANFYVVAPYSSNTCGAWYVAGGHGSRDSSQHKMNVAWVTSVIPAGVANGVETWPVESIVNLPAAPGWGGIENEVVYIMSYPTSTSVQVRRGQYGTAAVTHANSANRKLVFPTRLQGEFFQVSGPIGIAGNWQHNVFHQRSVGYIVSACSMIGDYPTAARKCADSWNRWYDLSYTMIADNWQGVGSGALINNGYYWGRWPHALAVMGMLSRDLFTTNINILGDWYWDTVESSIRMYAPHAYDQLPIDSTTSAAPYTVSEGVSAVAYAAGLNPSDPRTPYLSYWYRNLTTMHDAYGHWSNAKRGPWVATYHAEDSPQTDFRPIIDPWWFAIGRSDSIRPDYGFGFLASKASNTAKTASFVFSAAGMSDPSDHIYDQGMWVPGSYAIHKGPNVLIGEDASRGLGAGATANLANRMDPGVLLRQVFPWWQTGVSGGSGSIRSTIDRKRGSLDYVFTRTNYTESFRTGTTTVARAHRYILHVKEQGSAPAYVFVYDDVAKNGPATVAQRWENFHIARDPESVNYFSTNAGCTAITLKRPFAVQGYTAIVQSVALFPGGSTPTCTVTTTANSKKINWAWPATTTARMMIAHRLPANGTAPALSFAESTTGLNYVQTKRRFFVGLYNVTTLAYSTPAYVGYVQNTESGVAFTRGRVTINNLDLLTETLGGSAGDLRYVVWVTEDNGSTPYLLRGADGNALLINRSETSVSLNFTSADPNGFLLNTSVSMPAVATVPSGPPVTTINSDAFSDAFQVDDGDNSRIVVVPKDGIERAARSFTTTTAGQGRAYVFGLTPGTYTVNRDGVAGDSLSTASGDGSMAFSTNGAAVYTITLDGGAPLPVEISTTSLPGGTVGTAYSQTLNAANGTAPYTWSLNTGSTALPAGLSLSSAGVLSGTPTTAGSYSPTIRVTDATANPHTRQFPITIVPAPITLQITTTSLSDGQEGVAYSQTLTATGGTAPRTFSLFSGALPTGLAMSSAGVISGTPSAAGQYDFVARVTDAAAATDDQDLTITVSPPLPPITMSIDPTTLTFAHEIGQTSPPDQPVLFACHNGTCPSFTAVEATDCVWLSVESDGSDSAVVSVSPGGLIPGDYSCTVNVSAVNATNNPEVLTVDLAVTAPPTRSSILMQGRGTAGGRIRR